MAKKARDMSAEHDDDIDLDFMGSREETPEGRTVSSRNRIREKMLHDMEEFLAHGGKVREIDPHVTADPPRKPSSSYGGRPI